MMKFKKKLLVLALLPLVISACTPCAVLSLPAAPSFSEIGPDMQEEMERALAPIGSGTSLPGQNHIERN